MTIQEQLRDTYRFRVETPDEDLNAGAELAVGALWDGAVTKAGIAVPTVCGVHTSYPNWIHPYDNYWMNRVTNYFFPREATEWPIRLFAVYQAPCGEIGGGVYDIPEKDWWGCWEAVDGPKQWQGRIARPLGELVATRAAQPEAVGYGIYVRDHLFVLQVYDQWRARGSLPFLMEMYGPCRRALKYLEQYHDLDHDGLIETTCVLSDLVVAGDADCNSTARAEDQVMLYGALQAFAEMAELLGGKADAAWARGWARRLRQGLNELFWRPEGRYIFGMDRQTREPRLEYVTTTYANGYAILFGLANQRRTRAILDFMGRQEFVVPGPYHIPPVRQEDQPANAPGVYCNGGCGWGRGIMPSVALACFEHGRPEQGLDYLKRQAAAARKAGSFHEFWTWEKYTGKTEAGGAPWYSETSAGFLDALLHGLFGLSSPEPGFTSVRLAPQFPKAWRRVRLELCLPNGVGLRLRYQSGRNGTTLAVNCSAALPVTVVLPDNGRGQPVLKGHGVVDTHVEPTGRCVTAVSFPEGAGEVVMKGAGPG